MIEKKALNKRGFAIQFNWIFVLIGGAVILGFFFSLITNQASDEEKRSAQESTQAIDTLLKISLAARDTQKIVPFDKKIYFSCDEISQYYVEGAFKYSRYDYNVVFSPDELESKELLIQNLVFEAPFRTIPLVYVTNRDIEYVFVGDSSIINLLYRLMPENTTKKIIPSGNITDYPNNNYDHTVFVLNSSDEIYLSRLANFNNPNNKAYAIIIKPQGGLVSDYGEVTFYHYAASSFLYDGTALFIDLKTALGSIIGHNKAIYECNLKKILQRLALLSQLHKERMIYYGSHSTESCQPHYAVAETYFEKIKQYAEEKGPSIGDFKILVTVIYDLRSLNRYLITQTECPLIY